MKANIWILASPAVNASAAPNPGIAVSNIAGAPPAVNQILGPLQFISKIFPDMLLNGQFPTFPNLVLPEVDEYTNATQEQYKKPG